jgi:nicotinamidase-related amidase
MESLLEALDRTSVNAWEDTEFVEAVKATGRKKLIMTALWTEVCLAFPALDAMREGDGQRAHRAKDDGDRNRPDEVS